MTPDNINVSLIEQKGTPTAQTMLMNINICKEPENATRGNTVGKRRIARVQLVVNSM